MKLLTTSLNLDLFVNTNHYVRTCNSGRVNWFCFWPLLKKTIVPSIWCLACHIDQSVNCLSLRPAIIFLSTDSEHYFCFYFLLLFSCNNKNCSGTLPRLASSKWLKIAALAAERSCFDPIWGSKSARFCDVTWRDSCCDVIQSLIQSFLLFCCYFWVPFTSISMSTSDSFIGRFFF